MHVTRQLCDGVLQGGEHVLVQRLRRAVLLQQSLFRRIPPMVISQAFALRINSVCIPPAMLPGCCIVLPPWTMWRG